jgi:transposase
LSAAGVDCLTAPPRKIARPAQERVKTDRRDAGLLVRLLLVGQLRVVRVPTPEEGALRDLVRAREDLRGDLTRARHRVGKLLLRDQRRFAETRKWTQAHQEWLARVELDEPVA